MRARVDDVIVIEVDGTGAVVDVSGGVTGVLGIVPDHLVGRPVADCLNRGDRDRFDGSIGIFVGPDAEEPDPGSESIIVRLVDAAGRSVWVRLLIAADPPRSPDAVRVLHAVPFRAPTVARADAEDPNPFHALVQESADIVMTLDPDGTIRFVNTALMRLLETEPGDMVGTQVLDIIHPDDHDALTEMVVRLLEHPERPQALEFRARHADGSWRWVDGWLQNLIGHPDVRGLLGNGRDVTARRHAQMALAASEARFRSLASSSPSAIFELEPDGVVRFANTRWDQVTGRSVTGDLEVFDVLHPEDASMLRRRWCDDLDAGLNEDVRVVRPDGSVRRVELRTRPVPDGDSGSVVHVGTLHDVTELRDAHNELRYLATHDPLTGLPNRGLLLDRLGAAVESCRDHGGQLALLFVDLDRFKIINDSRGHHAGDEVLVAVAGRLADLVRPQDSVARFGGDEFVVLCAPVDDRRQAGLLADRIRRDVAGGVQVDGEVVHVTVSVGYVIGDGTSTPEALLRDADAAMYQAKVRGRDRAQGFDETMHRDAVDRLETEAALRRGLERDEFHLYFQPIVDPVRGRPEGVEALLRWDHPDRGLLAADDFLGVAEESGVLAELADRVVRGACRHAATWPGSDSGTAPKLFVNLTAAQLDDPSLVDLVGDVVASTDIDPDRLVLEVTEGMLMSDPDRVAGSLRSLRRLGVHIAVDDFGTGYSSLSHLTRLPVDVLKIDRSFVAGLAGSSTDREVASAIIALAHALRLRTVAEGVENTAQLDELVALGCDLAQGFLFSEPLSADRLETWLAANPGRLTGP